MATVTQNETLAQRLQALGFDLPDASKSAANYVATVRSGNLIFIAGQISRIDDDRAVLGKLGLGVSIEQGRHAAELAALGLLSQLNAAVEGNLATVQRIIRLGVFVNSDPDFTQVSAVADGASDLIVAVFGEAGRHARTSVGVASLPRGVAVEIDGVVELVDGK